MKAAHGGPAVAFACALALWGAPRARGEEAAPAGEKTGLPEPTWRGDAPEAEARTAEEGSWVSAFLKSLRVSGYVETSYVWNVANPKPPAGYPENVNRLFDVRSNEFSVHAAAITIERPVGEDQYVGFQVTPLIGQDAEFVQAIGLFKNESGVSESKFDLLDAYVQGYCPVTRTRIKLGKWQTLVGAEVIRGPYNDHFSRSYLFSYAIPFTHTGLLVIQPVIRRSSGDEDMLFLGGAVSNGWDTVRDMNDAKDLHATVFFTPCDPFSLAATYMFSFSEQPGVNDAPRQLVDLVATVRPVPDLKLVGNFDWGRESEAVGGRDAVWWGFAGSARYDFSPTGKETRDWYVAVRGEYFDDADGARLPWGGPGGTRVWEVTATLGYTPFEYLLLRAELRYDKAHLPIFFDGSDRKDAHQTTLAFEATFLF